MHPIFSADGHVIEPPELWKERLPAHLRDRALHYRYHDGWQDMVTIGDEWCTHRFPRPDGTFVDEDISAERYIADFEAEDVWGSTLYPNLGMHLFVPDHELAITHARVYNDYIAETFGPDRDRMVAIAALPLTDVDDAVAEIGRVAAMGLRGILVPTLPPVPYYTDRYERVWSAVEDHGLTVSMHTNCGFEVDEHGNPKPRNRPIAFTAHTGNAAERAAHRSTQFVHSSVLPQRVLGELVGAGVFERHPRLTWIAAELHAFWLASLMGAMDKAWTLGIGQPEQWYVGIFDNENNRLDPEQSLDFFEFNRSWPYPLRPSEYVKRQVKVTFMDDPIAVASRGVVGVETLVWGSDYPHPEATWPDSQHAIDQLFVDVDEIDRAAIMGGTLAGLYGIELGVEG